jgi:hypothetical protein
LHRRPSAIIPNVVSENQLTEGTSMDYSVGSFTNIAGMVSFNIPMNVIFQKHTLDEYRGRFWGLQSAVIAFSIGMGYLVGGILGQSLWMGFLFAGSSLAIFTIDLWAVNMKEIKEFHSGAA